MEKMDLNHIIKTLGEELQEYKTRELQMENDIVIRIKKEALNLQANANLVASKEHLLSENIIDNFLINIIDELVRIKPEVAEIAKNYKIHLILNNSKEKTEQLNTFISSLSQDSLNLIKSIKFDQVSKEDQIKDKEFLENKLLKLVKEKEALLEEKDTFIRNLEETSCKVKQLEDKNSELSEKVSLFEKKINPVKIILKLRKTKPM